MREVPADLERLRRLLDESIERAGAFLRASFEMPEHSLSAEQLCAHLQGSKTVALATTSAKGEPRVAPIGALFVRAAFHIPTVAEAMRSRQVRRRPAASLTYYKGDGLAVIAHGQITIIGPGDARTIGPGDAGTIGPGDAGTIGPGDAGTSGSDLPGFDELDQIQIASGQQSPREWSGSPVFLRLDADRMYTYAREPSLYPSAPG